MSVDYTLPLAISLVAAALGALGLIAFCLTRIAFFLCRRRGPALQRLGRWALALLAAGGLGTALTLRARGATLEQGAVDLAMIQAPRPPRGFHDSVSPPAPYLLLAGDLHCHVSPPDWPDHVARGLDDTIALARAEGLDFITVMPHVFSRFHTSAEQRADVIAKLTDLRARVNARGDQGLLLDVGIEYVDPKGHVGMVLGDVLGALEATPLALARSRPGALFEAFADRGGVLVAHHPVLTPIRSRLPLSSIDISWQPLTRIAPDYPPEIAAADARVEAFEAANLFVRAVRDRFLLGDTEDSTRRMMALLDQQIIARQRRLTPVGGTDSHSFHLRPMTFVLAEERSLSSVREAVRAGRTCVVAPGACTLEARVAGQTTFSPLGSALSGSVIEVRARGVEIAILRNGERAGAPRSGEVIRIEVPAGECSSIRALVDGGYSAPVYVNCPFAGAAVRASR